jgi:thioredoxin 1
MATIKSTDETFDVLLKENKILLTDFWATWCGPCVQIAPMLEEISEEMKEVTVAKHDIDEHPNLPTKFGVRGIPTMILFVNGEQKSVKVGATPKSDIISWIKENI